MIAHSSALTGGGEDDFKNLAEYLYPSYKLLMIVPPGPRMNEYLKFSDDYFIMPDGIFPFEKFKIKSYIKYFFVSIKKVYSLLPYLLRIRTSVDVCFVNSSTSVIELLLLYLLGIPFVLSIKELFEPVFIRKIHFKLIASKAQRVIVISEFLKNDFDSTVRNIISDLIYSSADEKLMKIVSESEIPAGLAKTNDSFRILNVGVICQMKNQKLLIEAASNLNDKCKYEIIFVGRIIDHNYYDLIRAIKLKERENVEIVFMGEMSKESVLYLMKSSDCVVITSQREGMSLVLAETLYLNKPLITTEVGVVPEIIKHGINGLIIDKHDPKYLADYLMKLASDDSLRCDICGMNTETYKEYFDLRLYLNKHEAILLEAIRKKY